MSDIITCSKCGGSGKFIYKSGVTGHCYQCNGKGAVKRIAHKSFAISIVNNDGVRIDWLHKLHYPLFFPPVDYAGSFNVCPA